MLLLGRGAGELAFRETPQERAQVLIASLEDAMLIARTYGDDARFHFVAKHLQTELAPAGTRLSVWMTPMPNR